MPNPAKIRVALIIVLFNPQEEDIQHVQMMAKSNEGIIVDNSAQPNFPTDSVFLMKYRCFKKNLGIAEAQNYALRILMDDAERTFTHFVLLDQDSRTTDDFPTLMAEANETAKLENAETNVAAIGPTIINKMTGKTYSSIFHAPPIGTQKFVPQREIIASGMCISRHALEEVGLNDDSLFIDMVDHEWCWRAASKGYLVGTTPTIQLKHLVGRPPLQLGRHTILIAAPKRYYYLCRNYLLLVRRPYVPRQWKVAMGIKRLMAFFIIPLTQRDGFSALRYMLSGLWDGLKRKGISPSSEEPSFSLLQKQKLEAKGD